MTYIKTDPVFQEDQEDLLMSYLNSDYMAPSTASPSPTTPKLNSTQGLNYSATTATSGFDDSEDNWHSTPSTPNDDLFRQQQAIVSCFHPDVLNGNLQFIIPSHDQMQQQPIIAYIENAAPNMMNTSQYFPSQQQQQQQQYQQHQLLQQRSASPRSLSSYSSSSDSEQLIKKRGRKKRASCHSIASSNSCGSLTPPPTSASNTSAAIAPAPTKHLPTILPAASNNNKIQDSVVPRNYDNQKSSISKNESVINAQSSHIINQTYTGSTTAIGLFANPNTDLQKAAIIAKRQERLIKNRAAALLSRKRKREHLSALEEQCTDLTNVNQSLLDKVSQLEKENQELKKILDGKQQNVTTEKFSGDIISMIILCYIVFIMSFSSYTKGLGGLFTNTKLAYGLIESSSTSIATTTSTSFQLRSYQEECTADKQQRKQTCVQTSSNSTLSSTQTMNRAKRGQFQRMPL